MSYVFANCVLYVVASLVQRILCLFFVVVVFCFVFLILAFLG